VVITKNIKGTIEYNGNLHPEYTINLPKNIIHYVENQGFPGPYDEFEEITKQSLNFYQEQGNQKKVEEIKHGKIHICKRPRKIY